MWLALSDDAAALNGNCIEDAQAVASDQAQDDNLARSLWEHSAQLVSMPADTHA